VRGRRRKACLGGTVGLRIVFVSKPTETVASPAGSERIIEERVVVRVDSSPSQGQESP
jgi:hypothetical protein